MSDQNKLSALSTPADIEPVAEQWCAHEDGHQYTRWMPTGYGDRAGWEALAKRNPEKYQIVTRPLYAAPVAVREPVSVPEGWRLVPKEPTQEMLDAVTAVDQHEPFSDGTMRDIFVEMCAAAPQPNPSKVDGDAVIERLTKALEPFAKAAEFLNTDIPDLKDTHGWTFQAIDFRRARAALAAQGEKP